MRIIFWSLLILNFNTVYAQAVGGGDASKKELFETKDQKFINNGEVCFISKKEQEEAKDYLISPMENEKIKFKIALTLVQIRLMNKSKFEDINCGLRYFLELFYEKNGRRWDHGSYDSWNSNSIFEYIKIMELVRTDLKYKADFEKTVIDSPDLSFYYGLMDRIPESYSILEPNLARKIFSENIISSGRNRSLRSEEMLVLFDLFYSKGVLPPKELSGYLKESLNRPLSYAGSGFMPVYLKNVNDLAYNDLFKNYFENVSQVGIANLYDFSDVTLIKNLFSSKYVPENFKCNFAKNTLPKIIMKFYPEQLQELSSVNHPCLKETISEFNRFVIPVNGCPEIIFKKNEDHALLLSKMSADFSRNWVECRKKCSAKEACFAVKESNGIYTFFNSKYGKDLGLYNEIRNRNVNNKYASNMSHVYDYKPIGTCTPANKCGEKDLSCVASDIVKKINAEIHSANYQKCNIDDDCYVYKSDFNGCEEFATNVNPCAVMGIKPVGIDTRCLPSNITNFINVRLENISAQCGFGFTRERCLSDARNSSGSTKTKCEKNRCVLIKK